MSVLHISHRMMSSVADNIWMSESMEVLLPASVLDIAPQESEREAEVVVKCLGDGARTVSRRA